jgi:Fe-Mn family superoxide dismutase
MTLLLPNLPYEIDALQPYISKETLEFHYGKHHQAYVTNGNKLIAGTEYEQLSCEEIIKKTAGQADKAGIFNNVAQIWNHSFYWQSMKPNGGGLPTGDLLKQINRDFGSYDNFKAEFATAGATQFGSGWAWLVTENSKLKIVKTANAETPISNDSVTALFTMDVWEHAYYIDYRNARPKYIDTFLDKLVNWDFAAENFAKAS